MSRTDFLVTILLAFAAPAWAQDPPARQTRISSSEIGFGVRPTEHNEFGLLVRPPVQAELKLTDAQKSKIQDGLGRFFRTRVQLAEEYPRKVKELGESPDPRAVQELAAARDEETAALVENANESLRKVLDRAQSTRLKQILLQVEGSEAFKRPEVQERLNMFPEQVELIQEIVTGARVAYDRSLNVPTEVEFDSRSATVEQIKAARESKAYKDAAKGARQNLLKARDETMQKILKVMTRGQRKRYESMVGEPFALKKLWETVTPGAKQTVQVK